MSTNTRKQKKPEEEQKTVVYCGPSMPGVAKQFTVYSGGLPEALDKIVEETPTIQGLIVSLDQLPEAMRQMREKDGHYYRLFRLAQGIT